MGLYYKHWRRPALRDKVLLKYSFMTILPVADNQLKQNKNCSNENIFIHLQFLHEFGLLPYK